MFHVEITPASFVSGETGVRRGRGREEGVLTQSEIIPAGLIHLSQTK